ncbi:helix-turn-helix domain-containing protein [Sphaerobacter sp.]|uniref:helix-turn-helix domain-containing protein n=1 Tax=Sphaerobacter sp. TaxID=2099654 RepID=UPI001DD77CD4|nr:helix-turn-helix domain-containing protein [Sphaerobacter sp.]MBX5446629.1 helix-turn-helix domain-containing protein [Sphaerobacter sp.]
MVSNPHPAYKPREAAALMNVHINTVYRMIQDGRLPSVRAGRVHRIPASALIPYLGKAAA